MPTSRLPRFNRSPGIRRLLVTDRDREIIRLVHRHRFLRSTHVTALVSGSPQQILRRLQLLYHHRYLERPREQVEYFGKAGPRHIVYGLGDRARGVLREIGATPKCWGRKNRYVGRVYLDHAISVFEAMVAVELACRRDGRVRLIHEHELAHGKSFRLGVEGQGGRKLSAVPDRVFALEYEAGNGNSDRAVFFLEADRATMPVERKSLSQSSFFRKMLAYEATWAQSVHKSRFGFGRFRVLTVTTSAERVKSLVNACSKLERGHGLFVFGDKNILQHPEILLSPVWQTGRSGELGSLLP